MELVNGTHKASKLASKDFISSMPDNVITSILDRLPLQEAVRTDILSRNWRFKWTMLSQLILDDNFFEYLSKTKGKHNDLRIISTLLLLLRGTITKFVLSVDYHVFSVLNVEDVNHWMLFLSRNGIEDLTLTRRNMSFDFFKSPTHLFSCLRLKHLKLYNCSFYPPSNFHGFPNLLSLELLSVEFKSLRFGEFIARCPALEILKVDIIGKVNLYEIVKLANLKTLSLFLCCFVNTVITSSRRICELMGSLPKLQELHMDFEGCKVTDGGAKWMYPLAFSCLKDLKLSNIDLCNAIMQSCFYEIIRVLPNLHTLEILVCNQNAFPTPEICSPHIDGNTMGPLQLRNVVFIDLEGSENEVRLIKNLLACSPFLKKFVIRLHQSPSIARNELWKFAMKLLKLQQSYPLVDIGLY